MNGDFGTTIDLDRECTKSESPELRVSVHEVPPADQAKASVEQTRPTLKVPELSKPPDVSVTTMQQEPAQSTSNEPLGISNHSSSLGTTNSGPTITTSSKHRNSSPVISSRRTPPRDHASRLQPGNIFDLAESDTESFHEKQRMHSGKRRKLHTTVLEDATSPYAQQKSTPSRKDGQFLVPSIPKPHSSGTRIPLTELGRAGHRNESQFFPKPAQEARMSMGDDDQAYSERNVETHEQLQADLGRHAKPNLEQQKQVEELVVRDAPDAPQASSQATTTWSQNSSSATNAVKNGTKSNENFLDLEDLSSKGREDHREDQDVEDDLLHQEAERLADEPEEQQRKELAREQKADEQRLAEDATEKNTVAEKKAKDRATERRDQEIRLAAEKAADQEKLHAEELAGAERAKEAKAKETVLAEFKEAKEAKSREKRLAEDRKIAEKLARERQSNEKLFAKEAEKMMLGADGARQLETERTEKKKAKVASKLHGATIGAVETPEKTLKKPPRIEGQRGGRTKLETQKRVDKANTPEEKNAQEEKNVRDRAQSLAKDNAGESEQGRKTAEEKQEKVKAVKGQDKRKIAATDVPNPRGSSEPRSRGSATPSEPRSEAFRKRSSMTPALPGSSVRKYSGSDHADVMSSSPLVSRSSNLDVPLRSALKQNSSALRRSVSFVEGGLPLPKLDLPSEASASKSKTSATQPIKSLREINEDILASRSLSLSKPSSVSPSGQGSVGKGAKTAPDQKGKVQTKLNVTRDKKMKGRVIDLPIPPTTTPKQEIILSSDDDESPSPCYSGEKLEHDGNAKAGPISRKLNAQREAAHEKDLVHSKSSQSPIDPAIQRMSAVRERTSVPASTSSPNARTKVLIQQKSTSRSPARLMSETLSQSSGSESEPASEPESVSEEDLGAAKESQFPSSDNTKSGRSAFNKGNTSPNKVVKVNIVNSKNPIHSSQSSQSSGASSTQPNEIVSMAKDAEHIDQSADMQLLHECRQSIAPTCRKKVIPVANGTVDGIGSPPRNQGLGRDGRLPNGIRPANYKYPKITELKKAAEAEPMPTFSVRTASQKRRASPLVYLGSSSSDDDDSSSSPDDDKVSIGHTAPTASSSQTSSGIRGLLKRMFAVK